jgi:alpha-glucosidase
MIKVAFFKQAVTTAIASSLIFFHAAATDFLLTSPDKLLRVNITIREGRVPAYTLTYKGAPILANAEMGFQDNQPLSVISSSKNFVDRRLPLLFAENNFYHELYNELHILLTDNRALVFRAYNDGMAFRYVWNNKEPVAIAQEFTTFPITSGALYQEDISDEPMDKWAAVNGNEVPYKKVTTAAMTGTAELPLLVQSEKWSALINEAGNTGYARAVLEKKDSVLHTHLLGKDTMPKGSYQSPWRYVLVATSALQLIDKAPMIYSLSPEKAFNNTSWIKPGKMMRSMQLNTDAVLKTIDFCHDMHFQYVLLDAGWYGLGYGMSEQFDPRSDALKPTDALDIPGIVQYGKRKNVGLILYVNEVALELQLPQMLPLYKQWGVAGLKFGFVNSRTPQGLKFMVHAVKQAADAGLIVDIHDNYRPTGLNRTYPNLLTQEGVRGAENMPDADHNTLLPFARFTTGAADYTIIYKGFRYRDSTLLSREERQSKINRTSASPAHQLALSVVFFSPMQCIFWYGNASDYDASSVDVAFFREVPAVWDESKAICGEPGSFITMARRNKENWFLGSITNTSARTWTISLHFLTKGVRYTADIYEDDGKGGIHKTSRQVSATDNIGVNLAPSGGQAVMIRPLK